MPSILGTCLPTSMLLGSDQTRSPNVGLRLLWQDIVHTLIPQLCALSTWSYYSSIPRLPTPCGILAIRADYQRPGSHQMEKRFMDVIIRCQPKRFPIDSFCEQILGSLPLALPAYSEK
jgi:hypothetical protein